ncbi:MAG: P-II family nitrogen regulator [Chthonomonas sp.]|nr:P-II family nitrogen regulator [Chthonomonas sp.]
MRRITAYIKPHRLEETKAAIADLGVGGMTVSDVRGCGNSPEQPAMLGGEQVLISLPMRSKIMVVVDLQSVEPVIQAILAHNQTPHDGDGKIFVEPVLDAIRCRTKERGSSAV